MASRSQRRTPCRLPQGESKELPSRIGQIAGMQPILDIADLGDRRLAAEATAAGAALFYAFGNFCALAARPDLESLRAMNALKGRPLDQVGSVTTTPEKARKVFAWDDVQVP